ncbi:MAG TPA: hypothetical protein VKZ54_05800 [Membranihabitans sp.]|nr:hypothetical protein [Membranihabitans sp.]
MNQNTSRGQKNYRNTYRDFGFDAIRALGIVLLFTGTAAAQESSNAYLLEWTTPTESEFEMTRLDLLTGFNSKGYNNQPFIAGSDLYLSSTWNEKDHSNPNIIALNINRRSIRQITDTPDGEFSPTRKGDHLYFIRLNPETEFQELWKYDGRELMKVIPETNVAYFHVVSPDRLAVVLIENNQLNLYDIDLVTNEKKKIIDNAGRSLSYSSNGVLYFVHKYNQDTWYIKSYDILTGLVKIVCKTIPGAEDFYLEKDRYFWMGSDNRIYRSTLQNGLASPWNNIFNLEEYPLNNIGRLCVIGDNQLVFINQ